jgi:acyl-CoA dehydrogenase
MMQTDIFTQSADKIFSLANPSSGFDAAIWSQVEEAGFDRLLLPEDDGGAGDAFEEATAIVGSMGRHAAAVPLVETLVANWCLSRAGLKVESGPKAFVALDSSQARYEDGNVLLQKEVIVCWAPVADQVVLLVRSFDGTSKLMVLEGISGAVGTSMASDPLTILTSNAKLRPSHAVLFNDGNLALALAALLKSAAMSGAISTALDLSIEYANSRKQFGKPIGAFQAVQHMVVRIASEMASVDAAVRYGAGTLATEPLWAAALAKGRASEAAGIVCAAAHQLHGAIGFTREYALHRYSRRLWSWREEYGNERVWYRAVGEAALADSTSLWAKMTDRGLLESPDH